MNIKEILSTKEYDFLRKNEHLKDNIILRIEKEKELLNEPLKCRLNLEEIDNLNKELEKIENEVKG